MQTDTMRGGLVRRPGARLPDYRTAILLTERLSRGPYATLKKYAQKSLSLQLEQTERRP